MMDTKKVRIRKQTQHIYKVGDVLLNSFEDEVGTVEQTANRYVVVRMKNGEEMKESAYVLKKHGYKIKPPYTQLTLFDMNRY